MSYLGVIVFMAAIMLINNVKAFSPAFSAGLKLSTMSLRIGKINSFATKKSLLRMKAEATLEPVRVRFAPSPTGSLHVGGARTALFNWLLAKKTGGQFIVRVEDTDQARSTKESEKMILDDLKWLNMMWDEGPEVGGPVGPYRQSERKEIYQKIANDLIDRGFAYRCFCTEEELEEKRAAAEAAGEDAKYDGTWRDADPAEVQKRLDAGEPYTVRFKVPKGKVVTIEDKVRGTVSWDAEASLGDFIILRSNGMPVYNFCVSVDDVSMKITHVIRAEEHLSNTLRQMLIIEALNYAPPTYAHCSLILGSDRTKMSKRHGATSVKQFSEQGFVPDAMMNYLANLGWNDGTDKEIYTPQELIEAFDLTRIVKSSAVFDLAKLTWINAQHLRMLTAEQVEPIVLHVLRTVPAPCGQLILPNAGEGHTSPAAKAFLTLAAKISQRDMELTTQSTTLVDNCLQYRLSEALQSDPHCADVVNAELQPVIDALVGDFDAGSMPRGGEEDFAKLWKDYMKALGKQLQLKGKGLFHPVRLLLTGRMSGPDVGDQIQLLHLSEGVLSAGYAAVPLSARIDSLRSFSIGDAAQVVASAAAEKKKKKEEEDVSV